MSPTIMVLTDSPHVPTTDSLTGNFCKITKKSRNGGRTGLQPGCRFTEVPLHQIKDIKVTDMIYNLGNRVVNNYLVSLKGGGYVVIDTGYAEYYLD